MGLYCSGPFDCYLWHFGGRFCNTSNQGTRQGGNRREMAEDRFSGSIYSCECDRYTARWAQRWGKYGSLVPPFGARYPATVGRSLPCLCLHRSQLCRGTNHSSQVAPQPDCYGSMSDELVLHHVSDILDILRANILPSSGNVCF